MVDTLRRTCLHPYFVIKQVATRKAKSAETFFSKKNSDCIPRVIFYFSFNRFFKPIQSCHVWLRWEEKSSDKTSKIQSILIKIETRKKWVKTQSRINQKVAKKIWNNGSYSIVDSTWSWPVETRLCVQNQLVSRAVCIKKNNYYNTSTSNDCKRRK